MLSLAGIALVVALALLTRLATDADSTEVSSPSVGAARWQALRQAIVWQAPRVAIEHADLRSDIADGDDLTCRFRPSDLGGTAAKFDCVLPTGEPIRVKYRGPERVGEAIATTLLRALGFGADQVSLVRRVRCLGCPVEPFLITRIMSSLGVLTPYRQGVDYGQERTFEWAAIERRFPGKPVLIGTEGWAWWELARAQRSVAGSARAQLDAFLLMAVFLAHWDNKPENQGLVCQADDGRADAGCRRPIALIQDAGATFGPRKVQFDGWSAAPIWDDRAACTTSMASLPYGGGTFRRVQISEGGRRFLADLLTQLSRTQIVDLFRSARIHEAHLKGGHPPEDWTRVFLEKTRQVAEGPRCPTLTSHVE